MTKVRAPYTAKDALTRIGEFIGWDEVARIAGKRVGTVRQWSEPDVDRHCPFDVAVQLDIAWRAAGGVGLPFHDASTHRLDVADAPTITTADLHSCFQNVLVELPQVKVATFAYISNRCPQMHAVAYREIGEAKVALSMMETAMSAASQPSTHAGQPR